MDNTGYLLALLAVTAGITYLLRALPFLLFGRGKEPPQVIRYIGNVLSPAAIAMLVVYCFGCYFRDRLAISETFGPAEASSSLVVVLLQLWKGNPLISILSGTALYMLRVQNGF